MTSNRRSSPVRRTTNQLLGSAPSLRREAPTEVPTYVRDAAKEIQQLRAVDRPPGGFVAPS